MGFPMLDRYIDEYGPAARELGGTVQAYADRVIARLDVICNELQQQNAQDWAYISDTHWEGTLGTGSTIILTLSQDEMMTLDLATFSGAATAILTLDGVSRLYINASSTAPTELRLTGPGEIAMTASVTVSAALQFKRYQKQVRARTNRLGFVNVVEGDRMGLAPNDRHGH